MLEEGNIFLLEPTQSQPSQEEKHQQEEIYYNAQAIHCYLFGLLRKCFNGMSPAKQNKHSLLNYYFHQFKDAVANQKIDKIIDLFKVAALRRIRYHRQYKAQKRQKWKFIHQSTQQSHLKAIMQEWKCVVTVEKISRSLMIDRKKGFFIELISMLRENRERKIYRTLQIQNQIVNLQSVYTEKFLRRSFHCLLIHTKFSQTQRGLLAKYLRQFKKHARAVSAEEQRKITLFLKNSRLARCFSGWKEVYHDKIAQDYNYQRLIGRYFNYWRANLDVMASERQIQKNNQCIAQINSERLVKKKMKMILQSWRRWVVTAQDNRHTNSIINTYADKKRKQMLLHHYFQKLKQNCINNKIKLKYYAIKLKRKAIDSLKLYFRLAVDRQEKIIDFMQKREIKNCFKKLVRFNIQERQKAQKFRMGKYFQVFTSNIIAHYCFQQELATNFNRTNLMFKVLFALKSERTFRQKEHFVIGLVNVIVPLRRWKKIFRIRKYGQQKKWFLKKQIFREWKLMLIRKMSESTAIRQFQATSTKKQGFGSSFSKMDEEFQFSNILSTIAKIRNNLEAQRQQTVFAGERGKLGTSLDASGLAAETPSQSIDYSLSLDYP